MAQITEETLTDREQRGGTPVSVAPAAADRPSPERLIKTRAAHRSYYRWLRLSRFALTAFVLLAAFLLLWLLPWMPSGLDTEDYTPELAFTVYLLGGVALTGMIVLALRELTRRRRESLLVWTAVFDEATGLHNRSYLYDRLSLECERSERSGGAFSLIVLQIRFGSSASGPLPSLSDAALRKMAEVINRITHPSDLVALLSGSELAVLVMGVGRNDRAALLERLRATVSAELPAFLEKKASIGVVGGVATYGVEGTEPGALVQGARASATLALPSRAKGA